MDYFGSGDPEYYLNGHYIPWHSSEGNPKDENIGWLAVSAHILQGALGAPVNGFYRNPADEYRWLENPYSPTDRVGTSIFIYNLGKD